MIQAIDIGKFAQESDEFAQQCYESRRQVTNLCHVAKNFGHELTIVADLIRDGRMKQKGESRFANVLIRMRAEYQQFLQIFPGKVFILFKFTLKTIEYYNRAHLVDPFFLPCSSAGESNHWHRNVWKAYHLTEVKETFF